MIAIDFCEVIPVFLVKKSKLLHYNIGMPSSQRGISCFGFVCLSVQKLMHAFCYHQVLTFCR